MAKTNKPKPPFEVPRPKWLELGATVLFKAKEYRIGGIRPGEKDWELMPAFTSLWIEASKVIFVAPPPDDYAVWPRSNVNLFGAKS